MQAESKLNYTQTWGGGGSSPKEQQNPYGQQLALMRQLTIKMEKIYLLGVLWSLIINVCKAFWYPEDESCYVP